jgi:excisionase family DNA binding protein
MRKYLRNIFVSYAIISAMERDAYYTVAEAAKLLSVTQARVRQLARSGDIEGERAEDGWKLFRASVNDYRDHKRASERPREAQEWPQDARDLLEEVRALERELGRLQGQRELEAVAESTLRESLERERQRVDAERERAAQERQERERLLEELKRERERADKLEEAQEESRRLREELDAERSKGFWRRLFG